MKKKILSCALALVMLFGSFMLPASMPLTELFGIETEAATSGDYVYKVNSDGKTVTITGYKGSGGAVKIPGTLGGKTVTVIGEKAFGGHEITSAKIPDSVTKIGGSAFSHCLKLESVKIPKNVKIIDGGAFASCKKLTSITIPNSVTELGGYAFANCSELKSVKIPDGVTSIGNFTFDSCKNLKSVTIGNGVKTIEVAVFQWCEKLKAVTIPDNVKSISGSAFSGSGLERIVIGKGVNDIDSMGGMYCATVYTNNSYVKKYYKDIYGVTCKSLSKWNVSPKNLNLDKVTSKTATISWGRVPEAGGYHIQRYDAKTKKYQTVSVKKPSSLKYDIKKDLKPAKSYKYRVRAFVEVNGKKYYSSPTDVTIRTRNAPVKITGVTSPKTRTVKVKWKKDGKGDGYEVQIAKDNKFISGKKSYAIKSNGTTSKTISGLTKGKTYYVRVRAYQTVNGKKFYGDWSAKKSVKCK